MKDISMHILDIAENSIAAGASMVSIGVEELTDEDVYRLAVEDNGKGMDEDFAAKATDPWVTTRTTRRVGMGLALLKHNCELAGGSLDIYTQKGKGTRVVAAFKLSHIDRPPAGDIPLTIRLLMASFPDLHLIYRHRTNTGIFDFDTMQIKEVIGDLPLNHPEVLRMCSRFVQENLSLIHAEFQMQNDYKLASDDVNHVPK